MGEIIRNRLIFTLTWIVGAMLLATGLSSNAAAAAEPEFSLSASPSSISWPDAPEFQYRLHVKAGSEPLDLRLKFPDPGWGHDRIIGSVFGTGLARLDGPGELNLGDMPPMPPPMFVPGTCVRGAVPWISAIYYELTLGAGEQTTVIADSRLTAAPLPATPRSIVARVWGDDTDQIDLTVPLAFNGRSAALIGSRFVGAGDNQAIDRASGQAFRLSGTTNPPLANRAIRIQAERTTDYGASGKPRTLTTVRTDGSGRFRTGPLRLNRSGTWVLKTSLVSPGEFDPAPSCAGAVVVRPAKDAVTPEALDGHTFRSIRILGRAIGQRRIRLGFFRHANHSNQPKRPTLVARAGCNSMGARYRAGNGRLRWTGPVLSPSMGCPPVAMATDRWLQRLLRKGVRAKLKGKRLILTRGKIRIVLRQVK